MNLNELLKQINDGLEHALPNNKELSFYEALHYSVFNGGKRLRPILVYLTGQTLGIPNSQLTPIACAIELIHCYSLVHDDLPAMDNANLRRGQPTCHKKFNEATAILVGDALLTLAFEVIADTKELNDADKTQIVLQLAKHSGAQGMVKGQVLDLNSTDKKLSKKELIELCQHKTGALLTACVQLPLIIKKPSAEVTQALLRFSECLGLGYQIQDDLLDIESSTIELGKKSGIDAENHKNTFPTIVGINNAKETLANLQTEAIELLNSLPFDAQNLIAFTHQVFARNK